MKSKLAKFLKNLRNDNNELLKDMALKTGVSISFLSAIENGTKKMNNPLLDKIIASYQLTETQEDELRMACMEENKEITIPLDHLDDERVKLIYMFSKKVKSIDDDTLSKIEELLNN